VTSVTAELYSGRDYAAQPRSLYAAIADNSVTIFCVIAVFAASHGQHTSDLHSKFALRPHHVWKYGRHPIPFLVPRRKVWLTPTARVPCSNAANIGECKVNFAPGRILLGGKSPQKYIHNVPAQETAKHRAKFGLHRCSNEDKR